MKSIRLGTICCFALAASVLVAGFAGVSTAFEKEESCFANDICVYEHPTFEKRVRVLECSSSGAFDIVAGNSARNRCGNKTDWIRINGDAIACMSPGGDRPMPGPFNEIFIAKEFGNFC